MKKYFQLDNLGKSIAFISLISSFIMSSLYGVNENLGSLFNYTLMGLLVIYIAFYIYKRKFKEKVNRIDFYIYIFLCSYLITTIINPKLMDNLKLYILAIIQLFIVFRYARTFPHYYLSLLKYYTILVSILNILSFLLYLMNINISMYDNRYCGLYSGPNIGAAVISFADGFSIIFYLIEHKPIIKKVLFINVLVSMTLLQAMGSRAGIIIFFSFILLFTFSMSIKKCHSYIKSGITSIVLIALSLFIYMLSSYGFLTIRNFVADSSVKASEIIPLTSKTLDSDDSRNKENEKESNFYRAELIKYGVIAGLDNPIFGVGDRNVAEIVEAKSPIHLVGIEGGGTHNMYVQLFVANGIIGLMLFLFIIIRIIRLNILNQFFTKNDNFLQNETSVLKSGLSAIFVCYLLYACFESSLVLSASVSATLFWMISGMVVGYEK